MRNYNIPTPAKTQITMYLKKKTPGPMECFVYLQGEQCHNLAAQLKKQYPDMAAPVLIEAAQFVKDKKAEQAQKLLNVSVLLPLIKFISLFPKIFNILDVLVLFYGFQNLQFLFK